MSATWAWRAKGHHARLENAEALAKRMLAVPEIAEIMREADSKAFTTFNPWGNHTRLQAMIDQCQASNSLLWCCQALAFKASQGQLTGMSAVDFRGGENAAASSTFSSTRGHLRTYS